MEEAKPEEKPVEDEKPKEDLIVLVDRLEKANKEKADLLEREERLITKRLLGGKSDAGQTPVKPKEPTAQEYAEAWRRGEIKEKLPGT